MNVHIIGGWAYASAFLHPLAAALSGHVNVVAHAFDTDLEKFREAIHDNWLAGWSLGGLRALDSVIRGDLKPRGLILISSTSRFCSDADYTCGASPAALRSMTMGMKRQREKTLHAFFADALHPADQAAWRLERIQQTEAIRDEKLLAGLKLLGELDIRNHIHSINIPVLLLHGQQDRIIPAGASHYLQSHLPSATLCLHPDAGHELPIQFPEWTGKQITRFIQR